MSKHTQGPWKLCISEHEYEGTEHVVMGPSQDPTLGEEPLAILHYCSTDDARLMVAAPDMLKMLKDAALILESSGRHFALWREINRTIAKAEGNELTGTRKS